MDEVKFRVPGYFDPEYDIFLITKRDERRHAHHLIIIGYLKGMVGLAPTRDELQAFVKIRRKRFIQVLNHLLKTEDVVRVGSGTKGDPYRYLVGPKNRE